MNFSDLNIQVNIRGKVKPKNDAGPAFRRKNQRDFPKSENQAPVYSLGKKDLRILPP